MIRSAFIGIWACAATVAGGYAGANWSTGGEAAGKADGMAMAKLTALKVKPVSVPVVEDGKVSGYLHAQIVLLAQAELLKHQPVKPDVFVFEAAFRKIYVERKLDAGKLDRESMTQLSKHIKDAVNARYGIELVKDVVIEEFGFTPMNQVRGSLVSANEKEGGRRKERRPAAGQTSEAGPHQKTN